MLLYLYLWGFVDAQWGESFASFPPSTIAAMTMTLAPALSLPKSCASHLVICPSLPALSSGDAAYQNHRHRSFCPPFRLNRWGFLACTSAEIHPGELSGIHSLPRCRLKLAVFPQMAVVVSRSGSKSKKPLMGREARRKRSGTYNNRSNKRTAC